MSVTISFRKDRNKYRVNYFGLDGRRHRPLFESKTEADNFARRIRLGIAPEANDSITIDDAGKKYFELESIKKNPKSRCNDKRYINLHHYFMTEERGIERLGSVSLEDMEAFREWMPALTAEPWGSKPMAMGPSTVNRCLRVMKHFYKRNVQWKAIKDSPCVYLEFLDSEETDRRAMSGAEYLASLEKADAWFKPVMQFMYLTGSPASCIERMEWADVDFQNRAYVIIRKKGRKARTKRIMMAMTDQVFGLLMMIRNLAPSDMGPVFLDPGGRRLLADRICRLGSEFIKAAGVKEVTLYSMRHALASDLTAANVATEIVRQAMGHQSIATTQRYANKLSLRSVAGAIETVRGARLVPSEGNGQRQRGAGFKK